MATDDYGIGIPEVICPVCGKTYIRAPYHLYKDVQRRYVCSWGCMLEAERRREAVLEANRQRRAQRKAAGSMSKKAAARERARAEREERAERDRQICSAFESGVSAGDIAEQFGLSLSRTKAIISASR